MKRLAMGVLLGFLGVVPAMGQKLDTIEYFKMAAGVWSGKGKSEVGPEKTPLNVVDVWKGQFGKEGAIFVQNGRISLSNGATFGYRWIYGYQDGKLVASYADTNDQRGLYEVTLGEDKKMLSVSPLSAKKAPLEEGLFSVVTLEEGKYSYLAEVRGADGKATVRTEVVCAPQKEEKEKEREAVPE